jgi:3-mercaptopyruvate sulfurtransferase SseA
MSDEFDPEDYEGVQPKMAQIPRAQVRKWEKQQKELDELRAKLAASERERLFARAGIPDDPRGQLFAKAYDGPTDDPAAVKAAWEQIFPDATQQQQINQALAGHETSQQLAAGAQVPDQGDDLMVKLRQAKSSEDVARIMQEAGISADSHPDFPQLRR